MLRILRKSTKCETKKEGENVLQENLEEEHQSNAGEQQQEQQEQEEQQQH